MLARQAWRQYRANTFKRLKYVGWPVALAFVIFLANLPCLKKEDMLSCLALNMGFGLSIFFWGWVGLAALDGFWTWRMIRQRVADNEPGMFPRMLAAYLGTLVGFGFGWWGLIILVPEEAGYSGIARALLLSSLAVGAIGFFFAYKKTEQDVLKLKAITAESRFGVLKNQMQPHFLFNALNSLTELIETDRERAAKMAQQISDLYRRILENSKLKTSTLESELFIVRQYLELEKIRFGERLAFRITAPEEALQVHFPTLVLQTLVENAIKHGISKSVDGGEVALEIVGGEDGGYRCEVKNSGVPFASTEVRPNSDSSRNRTGTGLANTISRLELLYGKAHGFSIFSNAEGRTVVSFRVTGAQLV